MTFSLDDETILGDLSKFGYALLGEKAMENLVVGENVLELGTYRSSSNLATGLRFFVTLTSSSMFSGTSCCCRLVSLLFASS